MAVAHEAHRLATKAVTMIEAVQPQLTAISRDISDMRRENTDQHRENVRRADENFKEVHTRISTVKTTMDSNRVIAAAEIKALDDKLSKDIKTQNSTWTKHKDKVFWFMALMLAGLIAEKLGWHIPGVG